MTAVRVAARLDIKAPNLVKGVRLEGLRVVGDPAEFAERYASAGVDELFYQDIVASLFERNSITTLIETTVKRVFVPLTVGGGLRTVQDIDDVLRSGADKVCVNTIAIREPSVITRAAEVFGSQCIVVAIEAIRQSSGDWPVFTDNGRVRADKHATEWARECVALGAGEILITCVDRDGTTHGPDLELIRAVRAAVQVPVIAHGGIATPADAVAAAREGADCIALASALHFQRVTLGQVRSALTDAGFEVRG